MSDKPGPSLPELTPEQYRQLSKQMRQGISEYGLRPQERFLAHDLVLETFDQDIAVGIVDLTRWSIRLGFVEKERVRSDRCQALFETLIELGLLDWNRVGKPELNAPQGTYRLRPFPEFWSRLRALRRYATGQVAEATLPLVSDRPLSEALSDNSQDQALACGQGSALLPPTGPTQSPAASAGKPTWQVELAAFKETLGRETVDKVTPRCLPGDDPCGKNLPTPTWGEKSPQGVSLWGEKSPQVCWAKSAHTQHPPDVPVTGQTDSGGKNPPTPLASLALYPKAKLAKPSAEKSPQLAEQAERWVREVDQTRQLANQRVLKQWQELWEEKPRYVLSRLRGAYEDYQRRLQVGEKGLTPINNVLAWLSRKARDEGMMRPLT